VNVTFVSVPKIKFNASDDDEMTIDSTIVPTQTILGLPSTPKRSRLRYSYPVSATEWTEYASPLSKPGVNFYIDSTGDRDRSTSMCCQ
jgi:hypothetical protein